VFASQAVTEGVLAVIYYETIPRHELVKEVNLGPIVHKKDEVGSLC
jgi:hypothetical protein